MTQTFNTQILNPYQFDEDYLNKKINTRFSLIGLVIGIIILTLAFGSAFLAHTSDQGTLYFFTFILGFMGFGIVKDWYTRHRLEKQLNFILNTPMPPQLWRNQEFRHERLTLAQKQLIEAGLRDFFILHALFPKRPLAMPSKMVDKLWHAFILDTQPYQTYCKHAFGSTFHHIPDYGFSDKGKNIQLFTWQSACRLQGIRPARPDTMPRLFGVDSLIVGGVAIGSAVWASQMQQMGMMYQHWHAETFSSSSSSSGSSCGGGDTSYASDYNDSCDVGVTSDGDCSCGSCGGGGDGGSSCGGGCGGGGGD